MRNLGLALLLLAACSRSAPGGEAGPVGYGGSPGGGAGASGAAGAGSPSDAAISAALDAATPSVDAATIDSGTRQTIHDGPFGSAEAAARDDATAYDATAGDGAGSPAGRAAVYVASSHFGSSASVPIQILHLDLATGALTPAGYAPLKRSSESLAIHPSGKYLYAANEEPGLVMPLDAFSVNAADGSLASIGTIIGQRAGHVSVHKSGSWLFLAHLFSDSISVLPIANDGAIGPPADPHRAAYPVRVLDDGVSGKFVFVVSRVQGGITQLVFDAGTGRLAPNQPGFVARRDAQRLVFHRSGRAFLLATNGLVSYPYDSGTGRLGAGIETPLMTDGFGHLALHPSKPLLYVSIGNSISLFAIASDGRLGSVPLVPPHDVVIGRQFDIDPTGRYLIATGTPNSPIRVYGLDVAGMPSKVGEVPGPAHAHTVAIAVLP